MPDFFDRLVARNFGLPADAYGVVRVRPRLPQIFERREPAVPEPEIPHLVRPAVSGPVLSPPDRQPRASTVQGQRLDVAFAQPPSVPRTDPAPPPAREHEQPRAPEHIRHLIERIVATPAPLLVSPVVSAPPEVRPPTPELDRGQSSPPRRFVAATPPPSPSSRPDPVAAAAARRRESAPPDRVVRISIGRVEVKAADAQRPRPSARQGRPATALSLEGYLATKDDRR